MKGLDPAEKSILIRIGESVDAAANNRTPTNPSEDAKNKVDNRLPGPRNITAKGAIRSIILEWDAEDTSNLLHYKITVTNLDNGTSETLFSFTNEFIYKGRIGGRYKALIQSVGRNQKSSIIRDIEFDIPDDVMLLEGNKNAFNTIGTIVNEDLLFQEGHKIFVWGAFTLDRLIAGPSGNSDVTLELYKGPAGGTIADATLIEQITMYAATESATNLDDFALGGFVERPDMEDPKDSAIDSIRGTSFQTSQSTMFSPFTVSEEDAGNTRELFVKAIGREDENDVTSLSITCWSAYEGASDDIPSDPWVPEPAIVEEDKKSIFIRGVESQYVRGTVTDPLRTIGGAWSWGCWFNPSWACHTTDGVVLETDLDKPVVLVHRVGEAPGTGGGYGINVNSFRLDWRLVVLNEATQVRSHVVRILIGYKEDPDNLGNPGGSPSQGELIWSFFSTPPTTGGPDTNSTSTLFPTGFDKTNDNSETWVFYVVTFQNGIGAQLYVNGSLISDSSPGWDNRNLGTGNTTQTIIQDDAMQQAWVFGGNATPLYSTGIYQGPNPKTNPLDEELSYEGLIHSSGVWNKVLTVAEIAELYDSGEGATTKHWRNNSGAYFSSLNLMHYWQFGAVDSELQYVARDTGYTSLVDEARLNLTDIGPDELPGTSDDFFSNTFYLKHVLDRYPGDGFTGDPGLDQ
jgi:hypothetical protein